MLTTERIMEIEQQSYVESERPVYDIDCWGDEKVTHEPTQYFNMFMFARAVEAEVTKHEREILKKLYWLCSCSDLEMQDGDKAREIAREIIDLIEGGEE